MNIVSLLILFVGGIAAGLYASTVGGGGLLSFPLLIFIGLPIHIALATQRLAVLMLEGASALKFHSVKKLNVKLALALGLFAAIGSAIGTSIVIAINDKVLSVLVGIVLVAMAVLLINKEKLGIKERKISHKHILFLALIMVPLGIYSGIFGAGGGIFFSMTIVLFGFSFIQSAAMSRLIGVCLSVAGTIIFALHGLINYPYAITLGAGFAIGSWIGIGIALKKEEKYIKKLILFVVVLTLVKLLLNTFGINFL